MDSGRLMGVGLLIVTVILSYQGWQNGQASGVTQAFAHDHACDLDGSCIVTSDEPIMGRTNSIFHTYEFNTTHGIMTVTCRRSLVFFGPWQCTPEEGRMVERAL